MQYLDVDAAELLPLAVEEVEGLLGAELDLDWPLGRLVQPLLDVHLVLRRLSGGIVVRFHVISSILTNKDFLPAS